MSRTTVTVPDALKRRMDEVSESVDWSAVACQAFEIELGKIAQRKETKDMHAVIDRLRSSKVQATSRSYDKGYEVGVAWATDTAEYGELVAISEDFENHFKDFDEAWYLNRHVNDGEKEVLLKELWEGMEATHEEIHDFEAGFVDGALAVYRQVADKL